MLATSGGPEVTEETIPQAVRRPPFFVGTFVPEEIRMVPLRTPFQRRIQEALDPIP